MRRAAQHPPRYWESRLMRDSLTRCHQVWSGIRRSSQLHNPLTRKHSSRRNQTAKTPNRLRSTRQLWSCPHACPPFRVWGPCHRHLARPRTTSKCPPRTVSRTRCWTRLRRALESQKWPSEPLQQCRLWAIPVSR